MNIIFLLFIFLLNENASHSEFGTWRTIEEVMRKYKGRTEMYVFI